MEVEPATEAGEGKPLASVKPASHSPPPPLSAVKLMVFSTSEGADDKVEGAPSVDPTNSYS
jgi:hypothetical protein